MRPSKLGKSITYSHATDPSTVGGEKGGGEGPYITLIEGLGEAYTRVKNVHVCYPALTPRAKPPNAALALPRIWLVTALSHPLSASAAPLRILDT